MRKLREIAREIRDTWPSCSVHAKPYLEAMETMGSIEEDYYADPGREIVLYFLSNATNWRGAEAKRIKAELRGML